MVDCPQWSECGVKGGGCCALGKYGGRPSEGTCRRCLGLPSAGLGDTIAKITSAFGVKPCGKCNERADKLNKLLPYGS